MPANFRCDNCDTPLTRTYLQCPSCGCLDPTGFFTGDIPKTNEDEDDD